MSRDGKRLGKLYGFLKLSFLSGGGGSVDGDLAILKKNLGESSIKKEDLCAKSLCGDAKGNAGALTKSVMAYGKPLQSASKPNLFSLKRIGMPKLGNYDPDVEYYEDFFEQFGDGPGNASHNAETQPPPDDSDTMAEQDQIYGVNSDGTDSSIGVGQVWGEHDGRAKVTSSGFFIPAAQRIYRGE